MTSKKTKTFFITLLTLIMVVSLFLGSVSALAAKPDAHQRCSDCSSNCKCIECFENCPTCKKDCPCKLNSDNHVDDKNSDKKEKEPIVDTPVKPESKKCADCHGSCDCTKSGNVCLGKDCPSCDRYKCPCGHSEEEQGGDDLKPDESHIHGNGKGCGTCDECGGCLCDHSETTCCWTQWKACTPCAGHNDQNNNQDNNNDNNDNDNNDNDNNDNDNNDNNDNDNNNNLNNGNQDDGNQDDGNTATTAYIPAPFVPFVSGPAADVEEIEEEPVPLAPNTGSESNATVFMACAMIAGIIACSTGIAAIKGSRKEA